MGETALDPENPLYSGHGAAASVFDADATMIVSPDAVKATLAVSAGMYSLLATCVDDTYIGMTAEPAAMIQFTRPFLMVLRILTLVRQKVCYGRRRYEPGF